jgi:uncharacterized membrane protein YhaH (DUF805 family)
MVIRRRATFSKERLLTQGRKPMNWYLAVLKKYAQFSGRARRTEYWMFFLFNLLIFIALMIVEGILGSMGIIGALYGLATLIPNLAVSVRRLHDTNRSGWWLLIGLVPLVGVIVLIVFVATEGTAGDNAYGPNPKAASAVQQTIAA